MSRIGRFSLPALLLVALLALPASAWAAAPAPEATASPEEPTAAPAPATARGPGAGLPEEIRSALFPIEEPHILNQDIALGNADLPLLAIRLPRIPVPVILVVDARNGKETWNFTNDPIILIATADGRQWIDTGILTGGKASGIFTAVDTPKEAVGLLQQLLIKKTRFF